MRGRVTSLESVFCELMHDAMASTPNDVGFFVRLVVTYGSAVDNARR
jgi:hypothetical protein